MAFLNEQIFLELWSNLLHAANDSDWLASSHQLLMRHDFSTRISSTGDPLLTLCKAYRIRDQILGEAQLKADVSKCSLSAIKYNASLNYILNGH